MIREGWLEFATKFLMELRLPDGILRLGCDVPSPPGAPLFPPALQTLDDSELQALLERFGAGGPTARGSGAKNWADLPERMQYILELFRSRQQDPRLFEPPFDPEQTAAIAAGQVPGGDL